MKTTTRDALLIVEAAKGFKRDANSLIRRAIKAAGLKVFSFVSEAEGKSYGLKDARFCVQCNDADMAKLMELANAMAKAEGWERFPVDVYHD